MNPTSKKLLSLFLVFSLMMLSVNLYAKERRGAKLIITKLDGQLIEGELITVKTNSLLLLDTYGKDVSIDIEDIKVIRIMKKSKVAKGALIGLLAGGSMVLAAPLLALDPEIRKGWKKDFSDWLKLAGALSVYGALIGAVIGALSKGRKKIQIEGKSDKKIREALDYLRKKARIRDYK